LTILGRTFTKADARRVLWTAGQAAVAVFLAAKVTDVKTAKVAALAALAAAGAAALSAVKNWALSDASPAK
jgi:uncharacterized membrane protein YebE (DUF533 family)